MNQSIVIVPGARTNHTGGDHPLSSSSFACTMIHQQRIYHETSPHHPSKRHHRIVPTRPIRPIESIHPRGVASVSVSRRMSSIYISTYVPSARRRHRVRRHRAHHHRSFVRSFVPRGVPMCRPRERTRTRQTGRGRGVRCAMCRHPGRW